MGLTSSYEQRISGRNLLESVQLGDIPGVGMVMIDGIVRCGRSRNTPLATEREQRRRDAAEPADDDRTGPTGVCAGCGQQLRQGCAGHGLDDPRPRHRAAGPQAGVTFGFTAAWGNKIAGNLDEPRIGLTGSQRVRVGERVKELVVATDISYYFQNAVA